MNILTLGVMTMKRDIWNKCQECGKFIAYEDFLNGAINKLDTPESDLSEETYITLCVKHAKLNVSKTTTGEEQ